VVKIAIVSTRCRLSGWYWSPTGYGTNLALSSPVGLAHPDNALVAPLVLGRAAVRERAQLLRIAHRAQPVNPRERRQRGDAIGVLERRRLQQLEGHGYP
jgi:hypothetical protein